MVSNILLTLVYLAGAAAVYYLLPGRLRRWLLLAASLLFYGSAGPWMLVLSGCSALWCFLAGEKIEEAREKEKKKVWLWAGILPILGVLFVYKYFDFFVSSVAELLTLAGLGGSKVVLDLSIPLGISYYTFKMISYLADIYLEKRGAERGVEGCLAFLTYILFFPQILSGPIERSDIFLRQLHGELPYQPGLVAMGLQRIVLGLFKKLVIANRLSSYVDTIFGAPESYPGLALILAAFFYSLQLYCDFSGYSDLAIGMANVLSIESRKNFDCPYFSRGIKEFWSRWHISLSTWLRDYIYIPLGGSRVSPWRHRLNLLVTFLVSGLWHGADVSFLVWGGLHGLWNMLGRRKREEVSLPVRILQTLVTFCGVTLIWVFFRAESLGSAFSYFRHAASGFSLSYTAIQNAILPFTGDNTCAAYLLTVCFFLFLLFLYERGQVYGKKKEEGVVLTAPWFVLMGLSILLFGVFGTSGFLYANF